jgi:hypothetical protein
MTGSAAASPQPPLPSTSTKPSAPMIPTASKPKGMQLGASKFKATNLPGGFADDVDGWGNDDLIDLNADEGDWSACCLSCYC